MLWRERRFQFLGRLTVLVRLSYALVPISILLILLFDELPPVATLLTVAGAMVLAPIFSSNAIVGERERKTFDLLRTTLLTPWQITWPKWWITYRYTLLLCYAFFLPAPLILFAISLSGGYERFGFIFFVYSIVQHITISI